MESVIIWEQVEAKARARGKAKPPKRCRNTNFTGKIEVQPWRADVSSITLQS